MYLHDPRAERPSATLLLRESDLRAGGSGWPSDHSSFGWGLCGVKGQLIVGFVLKISFSLSKYIYSSLCSTNDVSLKSDPELGNRGGGTLSKAKPGKVGGRFGALRLGYPRSLFHSPQPRLLGPWVREYRASSRYMERPGSQSEV